MNDERRRQVAVVISRLKELQRAIDQLQQAEQSSFEALSQLDQLLPDGKEIEEAAYNLRYAVGALDDTVDYLQLATDREADRDDD